MFIQSRSILLVIAFVSTLMACKKPDFESAPYLEFITLERELVANPFAISDTIKDDIITLTTYFEDGDGDLGLDINGVDSTLTESQRNNYWLSIYKKEADGFQLLRVDSSTFERLLEADLKSPINGNIQFSTRIERVGDVIDIVKGDTITFSLYLTDRAGNQSNTIYTDTIVAFSEIEEETTTDETTTSIQ